MVLVLIRENYIEPTCNGNRNTKSRKPKDRAKT